jgi:hypothetical protein
METRTTALDFAGDVSVVLSRDPATLEVVARGVRHPIACEWSKAETRLHLWGATSPVDERAPKDAVYQMEWRLPANCLFDSIMHRAEGAVLKIASDSLLDHYQLQVRISGFAWKAPGVVVFPPTTLVETCAAYGYILVIVDGAGIIEGNGSRVEQASLCIDGAGAILNFACTRAADLRLLQDRGHIYVECADETRIDRYVKREGETTSTPGSIVVLFTV